MDVEETGTLFGRYSTAHVLPTGRASCLAIHRLLLYPSSRLRLLELLSRSWQADKSDHQISILERDSEKGGRGKEEQAVLFFPLLAGEIRSKERVTVEKQ